MTKLEAEMSSRMLDRTDHYVVISADNHCGGDLLDYEPYLPKRWHEEFHAWVATYKNPWEFMDPRFPDAKEDALLLGTASWHSSLNWDSPRRMRHLEGDGVAAEVLFPNTAPPFLPTSSLSGTPPKTRQEYDRRWAGLQAHNRWLVDFCAEVPGRRAGVAQVMLYDIDDAVAEVKKIHEAGLTGGILLPMEGAEGACVPLHRPDYEPLWDVCEDLGVPVQRHGGAPGEPATERTAPGVSAIGIAEGTFFSHRVLAQFVFAGVFERHPRLRLVFTETGGGWVPELLKHLDSVYLSGQTGGRLTFLESDMSHLSMRPSEYFARNCYVAASVLTPAEAELRYDTGIDRLMWGQDYPHSEGAYPFSRQALRASLATVPGDEVRTILSDTPAKVFGFDLVKLQAVADLIGPTVEEIAEPLVDAPRVPEDTHCKAFA
jgi:predicted TIM-barrel fold metal-dependent hydrolase